MYTDNARISHRQLFRQILTGLLGIYFLVVPVLPDMRGRQGVLCLLTGAGVYGFLCIYFIRIRYFFQDPQRYMGKIWGKVFILLYTSWLWFMGVCLLLMTARITGKYLIEGSPAWAVILLAAFAAYLGSHQGLERRGRMAEVSFPILLLTLAGMLFLAAIQVRPEYLEEMGELTFSGWARGSWQVLCVFLPFAFLPAALGNVKRPAKTGKVMWSALAVITGLLILTLILLQGSFGLGGYEHEEYPVVRLMSGIRLPGDFLERVDLFWVAALVFGILFGLGSVFFYSHELLARIRLEKTALPAGGAVVLGALACEKAGISPEFFIEITMEIYGPLLFLLLILAGLTGKRGKIIKTGLLTLALLGMSGCGISLEDRVFPMSMGVDYENGHYRIVYGIPQLSKVTGQDKEETQSGEEQALAYEGLTPQDALERFNENQENYLDMGHMKAIILGEHIMENRDALAGFLGFLEDNPAVAGNIYVFVTEDMEALMSLDGQGVDSVGDYLTGILENTMDKKEQKAVILQDLYGAWHREEEFPKLPEVTIVNKKPSIRQHSG